MLGAPVAGRPGTARGDELSDAKAKQAQLKKDIAAQKADGREAQGAPDRPRRRDPPDDRQLRGINADLAAVKVKITNMQAKIDVVKADYDALVASLPTSTRSSSAIAAARGRQDAASSPSGRRCSPSASAAPTTPTARRCSSRSCRAARSPTCWPR